MKIGDLVRLGTWNGVVTDILESDRQKVVEVWWVKHLYQGQRPELLPLGSFQSSSLAEIEAEMARRDERLGQQGETLLRAAGQDSAS